MYVLSIYFRHPYHPSTIASNGLDGDREAELLSHPTTYLVTRRTNERASGKPRTPRGAYRVSLCRNRKDRMEWNVYPEHLHFLPFQGLPVYNGAAPGFCQSLAASLKW